MKSISQSNAPQPIERPLQMNKKEQAESSHQKVQPSRRGNDSINLNRNNGLLSNKSAHNDSLSSQVL